MDEVLINSLKGISNPILAKLGHKADSWELSSRPHISQYIAGHCVHCKQALRCQRSLKSRSRQVNYVWELVVGDYVLAEISPELDKITDLFSPKEQRENVLCSRFSLML